MDKKKDASSSSRKSSSHKKLMLRVHIPVSGSSLFLPFGSWRGLGMFVSDMERKAGRGVSCAELCTLGHAGLGCSPEQASPPHLGWAGEWGAVLGAQDAARGTEEYPHYPSFTCTPLLYKCSCARGCGFGSVCLIQFPPRLAARSSKRSVHSQTLNIPRFGSGNCPCLWLNQRLI